MKRVSQPNRTVQRQPADTAADAALLTELQERFPLAVAPFAELGRRLGLEETAVITRAVALRDDGVLRDITAIFEADALGYSSCLVAMSVPDDRLDAAVAAINAHPGVSHNYRREHAFNVWFTIAVPPGADVQRHIARLHEVAGARSTRPLPSLRMFKIGVSLDVSGTRSLEHRDASPRSSRRRAGTRLPLTEREIDVVRAVQGNLPLCARPFEAAASTLGMSDDALVEQLLRLRDTGRLRRIAGIIRHRAAGFTANGMGVWDFADDRIDAVGESMATYSAISHCYQRPRYDDWPYNLFTMIHARAQAECDAFVGELALRHGIERYDVLYSSTEYKKVRPVYFNTDVARWERENGITYEAAGS